MGRTSNQPSPDANNGVRAGRTVVFIDAGVDDMAMLRAGMRAGTRVVFLASTLDGVERIAAILADEQGLAAIHILCSSEPGRFSLGSTVLSLESLDAYRGALARIGAALAHGGELLLHHCDPAPLSEYAALLTALTQAVGAPVWAGGLSGLHVDDDMLPPDGSE